MDVTTTKKNLDDLFRDYINCTGEKRDRIVDSIFKRYAFSSAFIFSNETRRNGFFEAFKHYDGGDLYDFYGEESGNTFPADVKEIYDMMMCDYNSYYTVFGTVPFIHETMYMSDALEKFINANGYSNDYDIFKSMAMENMK